MFDGFFSAGFEMRKNEGLANYAALAVKKTVEGESIMLNSLLNS